MSTTVRRVTPLVLALCLLAAVPAVAGTLYVPILGDSGLSDDTYTTRIWLTNDGDNRVEVETLFLPMAKDGTAGREGAKFDTTSVAPGATAVLEIEGRSGMLEVSAPEAVVVSAELRAPGDSATTAPGNVPVVSSRNAFDREASLTLQGLRRTVDGVAGGIAMINLGHEPAQCTVGVFRSGGQQIGSNALLGLPALTHVYFPDALGILGQGQLRDAYTTISCTQPFYGFLVRYEHETGEIHFSRPSLTGESQLSRPGDEPRPTVPGAVLFTREGTFHVPTLNDPTKIYNIPVPANESFSKVVVDLDFFHGGWDRDASSNHSVFWIHRGACCWPPWAGNILGYVNAFGGGRKELKVMTNMGLPKFNDRTMYRRGLAIEPGRDYHVRYEYDAAGGVVSMEMTSGSETVVAMSMGSTVSQIRPAGDGAFMIYFGHEDARGHGPERASLGWRYSNLRVEFLP